MRVHTDGTTPQGDDIFVFGSNLAGRHGLGAALVARAAFGALYGVGEGPMGQSYAIPTKDKTLHSLPIPEIAKYVEEFVRYVRRNPDRYFFLTRIGCGYAGNADSEIAPLFAEIAELENVSISWEWAEVLFQWK